MINKQICVNAKLKKVIHYVLKYDENTTYKDSLLIMKQNEYETPHVNELRDEIDKNNIKHDWSILSNDKSNGKSNGNSNTKS